MTPTATLRSPAVSEVIAPLFIGANLAVFFVFAGCFLFAPRYFAAQLDITLSSASAVADLRAMYGGLSLGVGVLYLLGLKNVAFRPAAIALATSTSAGLALGRVITIVVDGMPGPLVLAFLASEIVSVAVGMYLLKQGSGHHPNPGACSALHPSATQAA